MLIPLLRISRKGWIKDKEDKIGFDIEVRVRKSKVGGASYDSCIVPFKMDGGIDMIELLIRDALAQKKIHKAGTWYKWKEETIQGMTKLSEFFRNNVEEQQKLRDILNE